MLFEGEIGVLFEVRSQPPFERCAFYGGPTRDRLWLYVSTLAAALEPAVDGRHRDREGLSDFFPGHPSIDGGQHPDPEIFRVWLHARRLTRRSTLMRVAVSFREVGMPETRLPTIKSVGKSFAYTPIEVRPEAVVRRVAEYYQ